jgi:protein-tyrosine phosphatase
MSFSVLFVCTGNICRSPAAERLFRARTLESADVVVSSAGTNGLPGWGIDGPTAAALQELGIDPEGHVSRRIDDRMLDVADLVLTATTVHRGMLLRVRPLMMARTFTIREFGRLAFGLPPGRMPRGSTLRALQDRVRVIADQRGIAEVPGDGGDDIADPFGASLPVARSTVADIARAVEETARALNMLNVLNQAESVTDH